MPSLVKYTIASEFRRRPIKTSTAKKKKKKLEKLRYGSIRKTKSTRKRLDQLHSVSGMCPESVNALVITGPS